MLLLESMGGHPTQTAPTNRPPLSLQATAQQRWQNDVRNCRWGRASGSLLHYTMVFEDRPSTINHQLGSTR